MRAERLCGWHGFAFSIVPSGAHLTLGFYLVLIGGAK